MESSKWVVLASTVLTCASLACTTTGHAQETAALPPPDSEPVARVAGETVTEAELTSFALQLEMTGARRVPSREALLDEYILTQLYDQIPTTATLEVAPETASPSPYDLVTQRAVLKRELRDELNKNIEVPRAEMEKWFEANSPRYTKPERVHAWHLFLETSDESETSSPEKVRTRLTELKAQIDAGTSFSQAAKQYSEAASGQAGGEIGMITRRMPIGPLSKPMNIELEEAFFSLPVGRVSDVVDTRHGMHLLYVTDKETTRTPTVDDMITSGILPGVLAQDRLTSEIKNVIAETAKKHDGVVLPELKENQEVTTDTVAFRLNGKDFTIGHLKAVFGPRFTNYLESAQQDHAMLKDLLQQALDDEAMVVAAIDRQMDKKPQIAEELQALEQREKASAKIDAIINVEAKVTDAEVQSRYDQLKDELRQPVAEGFVLLIKSEQATGTAEQARAREIARRKAEEIHKRLETEEFEQVAKALESDESVETVYAEIGEHVIAQTTETQARIFDQAISGISGNSGLSQVVPMGADFAIAKLAKRSQGEPLPLDVVRERLVQLIQGDVQMQVRENLIKRLKEKGLVEFLPGAAQYGKVTPAGPGDTATTTTH